MGEVQISDIKLTAKQQKFADEYLVDLNATQAAIRAGYSKKTAKVIGNENLTKPDIERYIAIKQKEISKETGITRDRWLKELEGLSFSKLTDIIDFNDQEVTIKSQDEIPEHALGAISSIQITTTKINSKTTEQKINLKLHPKLPALQTLGQALGFTTEQDLGNEGKVNQFYQQINNYMTGET